MSVSLILPSVDKSAVVKHESYLALIDLGGHRHFSVVICKNIGKFAQDDGHDIDITDIVSLFASPKESHIRKASR